MLHSADWKSEWDLGRNNILKNKLPLISQKPNKRIFLDQDRFCDIEYSLKAIKRRSSRIFSYSTVVVPDHSFQTPAETRTWLEISYDGKTRSWSIQRSSQSFYCIIKTVTLSLWTCSILPLILGFSFISLNKENPISWFMLRTGSYILFPQWLYFISTWNNVLYRFLSGP